MGRPNRAVSILSAPPSPKTGPGLAALATIRFTTGALLGLALAFALPLGHIGSTATAAVGLTATPRALVAERRAGGGL